jgi:divalent metal cation (Fe/Co/Zn/Cd) transporter
MVHNHSKEPVCEVPACAENPKTRRLRWVLRVATIYSGVMGMALLGVGTHSDNTAPIAEGAHQLGDTAVPIGNAITLSQEGKHNDNPTDYRRAKIRRARLFTAACMSIGAGYAGFHTVEATRGNDVMEYSNVVLGAELAAAGGSLALRQAVKKNNDGSKAATDTERHLTNDFRLSLMAASTVGLTKFGIDAAQMVFSAAATGMTARLAWLTGTGHGHNHGHAHPTRADTVAQQSD